MRFVVNVWNDGMDDVRFERTIPLLFNGQRLSNLGIPNSIDVLFLKGLGFLSASYKDQLRELGYRLHNVEDLAEEESTAFPLFVEKYANWGGIKHYGLIRFLIIPKYFGPDDVITFDGDMVLNSTFDDMREAFQDCLYFLDGSSCFGSIPASSNFFDAFRDTLVEFQQNPEGFCESVFKMSVKDYFDPHISQGTDQAYILKLIQSGRIQLGNGQGRLSNAGLIGFANWLFLNPDKAPYHYERRDNIDYLNGRKVLISHMSHDTCAYFGQFIYLWKLAGMDGLARSGRMPLPYRHYENDEIDEKVKKFFQSFRNLHNADGGWLAELSANPFKRDYVLNALYNDADLSLVLRKDNWHKAGFFI